MVMNFCWALFLGTQISAILYGFGPAQCEPLGFTICCVPIIQGIEANFYIEMLTTKWLHNSMDR